MTADIASLGMTQKEQRENIKDGKLIAYKCEGCGNKSITPVYICAKCGGRRIGRADLPNDGEIISFTIQKISIEEFINDVPFAYLVVKLDDGTLVPGWLPDVWKDTDIPPGQRVRQVGTYKPGILFEKI